MDPVPFGILGTADPTGRRDVTLVPLRSSAINLSVLTLGASLHTVEVPDRHGRAEPVNLSMPLLSDYEDRSRNAYLGATCGRYANRIANAEFELDGERHLLASNDGDHHLHGGPDGFARRIWELVEVQDGDDGGRVVMALESPDRDQGYPGHLQATATYELHGHVLHITYEATTDAPTVVSLTNHAYWNLAGPEHWSLDGAVADHELRIPATHLLPADDLSSVPTGPLVHVAETPFDLRHPTLLHDLLQRRRRGIDHSYEVAQLDDPLPEHEGLHLAAELHHPASGRTLTLATDQPALHVYTANRLGPPFGRQSAVCLEAQQFPDAPNRPDLRSPVVRPGERFRARTELTFGVR
ncbi:MAG: aldose epimerase family protein [Acidimicrobiales bacterium]